jgi:tyrosyl-DNA phosphodiesterase 2
MPVPSSLSYDSYESDTPHPTLLITLHPKYYHTEKGAWKHVSRRKIDEQKHHPSSIKIVTWNIDFQNAYVEERLSAILRHLETAVFKCQPDEAPEPCCIMLQEVHRDAFPCLLEDPWVRDNFVVTPVNNDKWPDPVYGNVTLVSRSLAVTQAHIVKFGHSSMGRTGVMVDIKFSKPSAAAEEITLRLINTHLESLPVGAEYRPIQLGCLASFLKGKEGIKGGVIVGDMNAIGPSDADLAIDAGLKDAWKRGDRDESGFTWGYQGGGNFPAARLDRVFFLPRKGYKVDEPKPIGVGLKAKKGLLKSWASDHYGLEAILRILR